MHRVLNRDARDLSTREYLSLNPNAVVPAFVYNGQMLIESSIIMVYIDEAFKGQILRTNNTLERARFAE